MIHQFISFHLHLRVKWCLKADFPTRRKVISKLAKKHEAPTAPSQQQVAGLGLGMEPAHPVSASEPPAMSRCQAPKRLVLGRGNRGGTALLGHGEARPLACRPLPKQQPLSAPALREHRASITRNSDFLLKIVIYLAVLGVGCGMQDLAPRPGIEPGPPALGAQSSSHWTTREVPELLIFFKRKIVAFFARIHTGHQQTPPMTSTTPPSTPRALSWPRGCPDTRVLATLPSSKPLGPRSSVGPRAVRTPDRSPDSSRRPR